MADRPKPPPPLWACTLIMLTVFVLGLAVALASPALAHLFKS